jgi:pilus assembly protein CpaB
MANLRPFIIALAFGLIAVILVYFYIQQIQKRAGETEVQMARVVRAAANIPPRTTIREHMVEEVEFPANLITPDTVTEMEEILGQVSVTAIYEQQILMTQMFREETALEDLSRMLEEGERAVTVGVTEVSGLGGNIRPGDHVDVMVTILTNDEVGVASTFTVLRNVVVMAVGQDIGFKEGETEGGGPVSKSITVRVNPFEAELLALASEVGSLRLSLRDPDDEYAPATRGTALTEFVRYTPTRKDLEEAAARAREEAETSFRPQPALQPERREPRQVGEGEFVELEQLGPPPILVELILGGESQIVRLEPEV